MKTLAKLAAFSFLAGTLAPATLQAASSDVDGSTKAKEEKKDGDRKSKNKNKNKDKDKDKSKEDETPKDAGSPESESGSAKDAVVIPPVEPEPNNGDWCTWLQDNPGRLYENKDNPWIQSFQIGGRFHYQAAYLEGTDINGVDFNDHYDEYRRLRFETKTQFLRYFTAEFNVNLVDDNRFRQGPFNELEWGYDAFDEASVEFDIGEASATAGSTASS